MHIHIYIYIYISWPTASTQDATPAPLFSRRPPPKGHFERASEQQVTSAPMSSLVIYIILRSIHGKLEYCTV